MINRVAMKNDIEIIWVDLHAELFKFVQGRVNDTQITKDIIQEVFLKVQLKIDQLKHSSKLTSWVYQITRNTLIDHFRNVQKAHGNLKNLDFPEQEADNLEYSKLSQCINQKIDALSPKYKEAIMLTTFKGYSQKELATYLNISYSGTKSRVQKARDILKEGILDCPKVESDTTGKLIDYDTGAE